MRVLYISPNGFMGGAERFVYNCAKGHLESGKIKPVFLFLNDGECYQAVKSIYPHSYLLPFKMKLSHPVLLIKTLLFIRSVIKKENITIIHATMPYSHILAYFSTLFMQVKRVWFQHGPVGGTLDKIAVTLPVDKILFNSAYLQQVHNTLLFARVNIVKQSIIHLGIEDYKKEELTLSKTSHCKTILSIGRICRWKGQLEVIKALHFLGEDTQSFPTFKLVILGKPNSDDDKEYFEQIKSYISDNKLESIVELKGHTTRPQDYLAIADLFIHSSTTPEPFGLVVAEAMINRCFVIGSDEGGVTDILINDKTGLSYNTTQSPMHTNLIKVLRSNQSLIFGDDELSVTKRNSIINNAQAFIKNNYSIERMTQELECVYGEL